MAGGRSREEASRAAYSEDHQHALPQNARAAASPAQYCFRCRSTIALARSGSPFAIRISDCVDLAAVTPRVSSGCTNSIGPKAKPHNARSICCGGYRIDRQHTWREVHVKQPTAETVPLSLALLAASLGVDASSLKAQSITGLWDGVLHTGDFDLPFRIEFAGAGPDVQGRFLNGDEHVTSAGGRWAGKSLTLNFDHYASRLEATLNDSVLKGKYGNPSRTQYEFEARPHQQAAATKGDVLKIGGL